MKLWIGFTLIVLTTASCKSTRMPAYEDAIDAGAARSNAQRSGEAVRKHATYEDAIDAGSVDASRRPSSSTGEKPSKYEDAIDAGHPHTISGLSAPETERERDAARVGRALSGSRA